MNNNTLQSLCLIHSWFESLYTYLKENFASRSLNAVINRELCYNILGDLLYKHCIEAEIVSFSRRDTAIILDRTISFGCVLELQLYRRNIVKYYVLYYCHIRVTYIANIHFTQHCNVTL